MGDTMLHGVLCMPPELWQDTELDKRQRYSRYLAASRRIEDDEREIVLLREALAAVINSDVGRQTLAKLADGQGTDTADGRAWLRSAEMVRPNAELSGPRPLVAEWSRSNDVLGAARPGKDGRENTEKI